jgi:glutathione-independent formaldehyde dehydrogenase
MWPPYGPWLRLKMRVGSFIPVDQILELTGGEGADTGCECVGYHAHDPQGHEQANMTMNNLIGSVCATGGIGVVGVFLPEGQKSSEVLAQKGQLALDWGLFWSKGQRIGTWQANV